jgi:hypothetical protein
MDHGQMALSHTPDSITGGEVNKFDPQNCTVTFKHGGSWFTTSASLQTQQVIGFNSW